MTRNIEMSGKYKSAQKDVLLRSISMCDTGDFFSALEYVFFSFFLVFFPSLGLDLLLSIMTGSIKAIKFFLADELLSGPFAIGIVNSLELIERRLAASFGGNLPMSDPNLVVAKVIVFH